jgi:protein ImuB
MAFASIHLPGFLIQALIRTNPPLRQRAIALVDGTPPLWKVIAANEMALRAGIQLGMAKSQATQFCDIEIRHRVLAHEYSAHAALLDLGWSMSPRIEDTQPDTLLADVSGLASLFGSAANIAREFVARASRLGLTVNIAFASNIEAAILASHGFAGITLIPPGEEERQLAQLPVETLPATSETLEVLDRWGVRTCSALAALPLLDLSERLGQEGVRLHELARGINTRSLVPTQASLHFEEEMALDDSVDDLEPLSFILGRLLDQLCARLNARALAVQFLHIRFELEPENGLQRLKYDPSPLQEKPIAKVYEKTLSLPVPIRDSKTLLNLLRLHLQSHPPGAPILKVIIRADPAAPRSAQGGLFVPASPDPEKLELTVARLANLVGETNVGSPEWVDTHRPGEFRIARFRPANIAAENRKGLNSCAKQRKSEKTSEQLQSPSAVKATSRRKSFLVGRSFSSDNKSGEQRPSSRGDFPTSISQEGPDANAAMQKTRRPVTAFRAFRPPPPAKVDVRNARPARVAFNGQLASVIVASGPWRTSGDWWRDDAWQLDEWDLELRFEHLHEASVQLSGNSRRKSRVPAQIANSAPQTPSHGVYCLYFDVMHQNWFVRGIYD